MQYTVILIEDTDIDEKRGGKNASLIPTRVFFSSFRSKFYLKQNISFRRMFMYRLDTN